MFIQTEQNCNSTLQTLNACPRVGGTFNRDGHQNICIHVSSVIEN